MVAFALLGGFLGVGLFGLGFFCFVFIFLFNCPYLDLQTFSLLFILFSPPSHCRGSGRVAVWGAWLLPKVNPAALVSRCDAASHLKSL